ncbi:hypothetical protein ZHAS_00003462 [Anopheles sinensis]|uniref:Uncharacterized protein n=1 Tax=Anopheles sinensis TaxID=74873 RepID=A0A084VEE3_ANOSI|nr:hypothetical protein ZHAS_00003462 [Anopheles sinensis]
MRTRLASLIVVKQEPLSSSPPPPPSLPPAHLPLSSTTSSSSSGSSSSSSSSPPTSLFRSSLVVADGDGLQCHYGSFGPISGPIEVNNNLRNSLRTDGGDPAAGYRETDVPGEGGQLQPGFHHHHHAHPHAGLVAQYFCERNGHGHAANGLGGDLNNNDQPGKEFEFFNEKKSKN